MRRVGGGRLLLPREGDGAPPHRRHDREGEGIRGWPPPESRRTVDLNHRLLPRSPRAAGRLRYWRSVAGMVFGSSSTHVAPGASLISSPLRSLKTVTSVSFGLLHVPWMTLPLRST